MIFEFSNIVCYIWFKEPSVSIFSCIEASKSTKNSSFGSIDLQVLMAGDTMSILIKSWKIRFDNLNGNNLNYDSLV